MHVVQHYLFCSAQHCIPPVRMGAAPWRPVSYPLQECSPSTSVFSKNRFRINRENCHKISTVYKISRWQSNTTLQHLRSQHANRCKIDGEIFLETSTFSNIFEAQLNYSHLASVSSNHGKNDDADDPQKRL